MYQLLYLNVFDTRSRMTRISKVSDENDTYTRYVTIRIERRAGVPRVPRYGAAPRSVRVGRPRVGLAAAWLSSLARGRWWAVERGAEARREVFENGGVTGYHRPPRG